jgi:formate/nitrite transporter
MGLLALAIHQSGILDAGNVRATAIAIAEAKVQLSFGQTFVRGILCNMLVCLAVWLSLAARGIEGKVVAIVFPISAFVALGFEHCVANLYLLPVAMLNGANIDFWSMLANIVPVTLGNTVGGAGIATAYWFTYLCKVSRGRGLPAKAPAISESGWTFPNPDGTPPKPIWLLASKSDRGAS